MVAEIGRQVPYPEQVDFSPPTLLPWAKIPPEEVLGRLALRSSSRPVISSIQKGSWSEINGGRIIVETRNPNYLRKEKCSRVGIYDFDDCLISSTAWHKEEYKRISSSPILASQGVNISLDRAKTIYEASKINVDGKADKEKRYTPLLNMVLLSFYGDRQRMGVSDEVAWAETQRWRDSIVSQVNEFGEGILFSQYHINPEIRRIFINNACNPFVYSKFIEHLLKETQPSDLRIIATRGMIEGPLGQIEKVHSSGIFSIGSRLGRVFDLVVYSNDLKVEALLSLTRLLPWVIDKRISIYDDNTAEIIPYLNSAHEIGVRNLEIIHVGHRGSKRKEVNLDIEPSIKQEVYLGEQDDSPILSHFFAYPYRKRLIAEA